jgi:glycosyltransferase involved in cell wall biosynthesis
MRIVLTTDVIHAGGAETFVLRLAQALHKRGHEVFIYVLYETVIDKKVLSAIAPDVSVHAARLPFLRFLQLADSFFLKAKMNISPINSLLVRDMQKYIVQNKIEVIHSHLFTADQVALEAVKTTGTSVVTTMHGDYSLYMRRLRQGIPVRILNFEKKMHRVLSQLRGIVCISNEQLAFFRNEINRPDLALYKIYNGYSIAEDYRTLSRKDIGIPEDAFVFGMVARGIPEKGWQPVIQSFLHAERNNAWLLLIGDSEYVQKLKEEYREHKKIIFAGYSSNPVEYIKLFDAGLFASTYFAESLPTVIIEYLACRIPVISVDIAECKHMLEENGVQAGIMVSLEDGKVPVREFSDAMQLIMDDASLYHELRGNTQKVSTKFDMDRCVQLYESIYEKSINRA